MVSRDRRRRKRNPRAGFLTVNEAAEIAGLSPAAIRWNIGENCLPAQFDGYRWHISRQDLERFLGLFYE